MGGRMNRVQEIIEDIGDAIQESRETGLRIVTTIGLAISGLIFITAIGAEYTLGNKLSGELWTAITLLFATFGVLGCVAFLRSRFVSIVAIFFLSSLVLSEVYILAAIAIVTSEDDIEISDVTNIFSAETVDEVTSIDFQNLGGQNRAGAGQDVKVGDTFSGFWDEEAVDAQFERVLPPRSIAIDSLRGLARRQLIQSEHCSEEWANDGDGRNVEIRIGCRVPNPNFGGYPIIRSAAEAIRHYSAAEETLHQLMERDEYLYAAGCLTSPGGALLDADRLVARGQLINDLSERPAAENLTSLLARRCDYQSGLNQDLDGLWISDAWPVIVRRNRRRDVWRLEINFLEQLGVVYCGDPRVAQLPRSLEVSAERLRVALEGGGGSPRLNQRLHDYNSCRITPIALAVDRYYQSIDQIAAGTFYSFTTEEIEGLTIPVIQDLFEYTPYVSFDDYPEEASQITGEIDISTLNGRSLRIEQERPNQENAQWFRLQWLNDDGPSEIAVALCPAVGQRSHDLVAQLVRYKPMGEAVGDNTINPQDDRIAVVDDRLSLLPQFNRQEEFVSRRDNSEGVYLAVRNFGNFFRSQTPDGALEHYEIHIVDANRVVPNDGTFNICDLDEEG